MEVSGFLRPFPSLDLRLPTREGLRRIPVLVVSESRHIEEELPDAFAYIAKPLNPAQLDAAVELLAARPPLESPPSLNDTDYRLFRDHLLAQCGLHFEARNRSSLKRGLWQRMEILRLPSFREYFNFLTETCHNRNELQKLLQHLTVGETYFFRYRAQFDAFAEEIRTKNGPIQCWSAGCSTGEEPYSLAMAALDARPGAGPDQIRILATDINNRSLQRARRGVYSPWSLRGMEPCQVERYFRKNGNEYQVRDEVKRLVEFSHQNLCEPDPLVAPPPKWHDLDAIFCRNVTIYFTRQRGEALVRQLATRLRPEGMLFLGHAETVSGTGFGLESIRHGGCFYYQRRPDVLPAVEPLPAPTELAAAPEPGRVEPRRTPGPLRETAPQEPRSLALLGFLHAVRGELAEALSLSSRALELDDLFPDGYFVKGMVLAARELLFEAAAEYQKALLLDPEFVVCRHYLGRLYLKLGRNEEAVREMRNGIRILARGSRHALIPYSGGLTATAFLQHLEADLAQVG